MTDVIEQGIRPGALTRLLSELAQAPEGDAASPLVPGSVVGRFELVREIGRGAFGVVWEARDRELGRSVAFKVVRAGGRAALRAQRLALEAEAAARLTHPNIVTLHDAGRCEQGPYLVLELLRGETLEARLERERLAAAECVHVAVEIARALAHAHAAGVAHRDLKPGNVFLCEDGRVKVLDFGMAHAFGRRKIEGGTPAFMAPEQRSGAPEDERSDVFALGVILHRMLTGALPPAGARGHSGGRPAPDLARSTPPAIAALVVRMLERDPRKRPRDGAEVLAALSAIVAARSRRRRAPRAVAPRARPGRRPKGAPGHGRAPAPGARKPPSRSCHSPTSALPATRTTSARASPRSCSVPSAWSTTCASPRADRRSSSRDRCWTAARWGGRSGWLRSSRGASARPAIACGSPPAS